ncbi:unnamed protein product, partial [Ectocarpus sp. 13 AM-2016]
ASERIWRASLSGNHNINNNSYHEHGRRNGGGRAKAKDASKAGVVPGGVRDDVSSTKGMGLLKSEGHRRHQQRQAPQCLPSGARPMATPSTTSRSAGVDEHDKADPSRVATGDRTAARATTSTPALFSVPPSPVPSSSPAAANNALSSEHPPCNKLPPEVLASMLLSDPEDDIVGKEIVPAASALAERTRQWELQQQRDRQLQQQQRRQQQQLRNQAHVLLQPFPDLPYGFTDLGRRVNVDD